MQILPVLDLKNGIAVHAVAGQRSSYRPVRSVLADSCDPTVLLREFERLGCRSCYIADLDAIEGRTPNRCTLAELARSSVALTVDAGIRNRDDIAALLDLDVAQVIVALETLSGPDLATQLASEFGQQLTLSLDLRNGSVVTPWSPWAQHSPMDLADTLLNVGYSSLIVLDVAAVGLAKGPQRIDLCRRIKTRHPDVRLITGGGIRNALDLQALQSAGLDAALVATALHNGQLTAEDIQPYVSS